MLNSDSAFVDRADIAEYIGYPPTEAVYEILRSSLLELMQKGIVAHAVSYFEHYMHRNSSTKGRAASANRAIGHGA